MSAERIAALRRLLDRYIEVGEQINRELVELGFERLVYSMPQPLRARHPRKLSAVHPDAIEAGLGFQPRARMLAAALKQARPSAERQAA